MHQSQFLPDFLSGTCRSLLFFLVQISPNFPISFNGYKHNYDNRLDLALVCRIYLFGFLDIYHIIKDFRDYCHKKKISVSYFRGYGFIFIEGNAILKWNCGVLSL